MLMITNVEAQMGIYLEETYKLFCIAGHLGLSSKLAMLPIIRFSYAVWIYIFYLLNVDRISKN